MKPKTFGMIGNLIGIVGFIIVGLSSSFLVAIGIYLMLFGAFVDHRATAIKEGRG